MIRHPRRTRRRLGAVLVACLLVSLIAVAYPLYVIRPFRAQGARELALALVVSRFRPAIAAISAVVALVLLPWYWQAQPRRWRRVLAIAGAVLVCVLAALARVNVYELMFHPIDRASFAPAPEATLDQDEKVIGVKIGARARAYPIRSLSYHHIVNDVLGKTAIVATY